MLQDAGVDKITIMDSAGTRFPEEAAAYTKALKAAVSIPVGFRGHSNLGLSQANALATAALPPVERFAMLPGEGVTAVVGGRTVKAGNRRLLGDMTLPSSLAS